MIAVYDAARPGFITPVSLLTGFFGSGKTTLLNRLLKHPDMGETAVLVNEFGEIGLDHVLVEAVDDDVVLLNAGCLCCTVRGELSRSLRELFVKRVGGEVPPFRRLLIETTGLADPAPIIHTLMTDPVIRNRYALDAVVATVDAVHGAGQLDRRPESVKQAAVADRIVMTKCDLAGADGIAALERALGRLNPGAPILRARFGDVEPNRLFGVGLHDPASKTSDVRLWLRAEAYESRHHHSGHGAAAEVDVNRHDAHIRAYALSFAEPFDWAVLTVWIQKLIAAHGERLLRIKGIVFIAGEDGPLAIHGVQHIFHDPIRLAAPADGPRISRMVFITHDLERAAIEDMLAAIEREAAGLAT